MLNWNDSFFIGDCKVQQEVLIDAGKVADAQLGLVDVHGGELTGASLS